MAGDSSGGGIIRAEMDALAADAHQLQAISDTQAQLMHSLGSTMEELAGIMQGEQVSPALAACGERLIHDGQQFSARFADHSEKMTNNRVSFDDVNEQNAMGFNAIQGGITI